MILRKLLIVLPLVVGCDILPTPGPDKPDVPVPQVIELRTPPYNDDEPILAYAIAKSTGTAPAPAPTPDDGNGVKVGDVCPVCNGRGKSGDGIKPCDPCGADGRVDEGDPVISGDLPEVPNEQISEESILIEYARKDELENSFNKLSDDISELRSSLNEAFTRIKAVEPPSPPQETEDEDDTPPVVTPPAARYRIKYQNEFYEWNEQQKAFIHPGDRRRINFTGEGVSTLPQVQVCVAGQNCVLCPIEKF